MTPQEWSRIEEIYHSARDRSPEEREAFIAEACAGDNELRREVYSLLSADQQASGFLARPAVTVEAATAVIEAPVLPHYSVESRLGSGGMGEVWLARDTRLGRQVALKILPPTLTRHPNQLQRFTREARAASSLNHPNIITIYEIGESGGTHFIATEFIRGVTLRPRLSAGKIPIKEALGIVLQIANALEAAHNAGVIHRDIKPENVMLRPDGLVKVLDFGLARADAMEDTQSDSGEFHTATGVIMGTPRYMSPEQARGRKVDARADIFSLGVVLYEMIAGEPPFKGETTAEVFAALLDREPAPLTTHLNGHNKLDYIVRRALDKNPENRYPSARAFITDLEEISRDLTLNRITPVPRKIDFHWRPRPWMLAAAGALVLGAAGGYFGVDRFGLGVGPPPETVPFATFPGSKEFSTFSPDGNQIAFAWDGGKPESRGNRDIYVKLIGVGEPVRLTSAPEDESFPAWSPDGKHIAFMRHRAVCIIPALPGGTERKLGEGTAGLSWSPDGKMLAVGGKPEGDDSGSIQMVSVATGERRRITFPTRPQSDNYPVFSPDGTQIAFIRGFTTSGREIMVVPTKGGTPRQITNDRRPILGLTWTADGEELVYSTIRTGGRALWRISVNGGEPKRVVTTGRNATYPAISRQGNRLAFTDGYTDTNVYLFEGPGFEGNPAPGKFGAPRLLISSTRDDHSPQISPDGQRIAFVSSRTGSEEIWVSRYDGTDMTQLSKMDGPATGTPRWSPDGRWIAFDSRPMGSADVFVISSEDGHPIRFTKADTFEGTPSWSNDGQWIYFASDRGGDRNTWRQRIDTNGQPVGEPVQVTKGGSMEGFESPDGKEFWYTKDSGRYGLWRVPVEGGEETRIDEPARAGFWRSWGVLPQGIYFISRESTPLQTAKFFSFVTRKEVALTTVPREPIWYQPGLAISRDGRRMTYAQRDHQIEDMLLIENFR